MAIMETCRVFRIKESGARLVRGCVGMLQRPFHAHQGQLPSVVRGSALYSVLSYNQQSFL